MRKCSVVGACGTGSLLCSEFRGPGSPQAGAIHDSERPTAHAGAAARSRLDPPPRESSASRLMMSAGRGGAAVAAIPRSTSCITFNRASPASAVPNYARMSCRARQGSPDADQMPGFTGHPRPRAAQRRRNPAPEGRSRANRNGGVADRSRSHLPHGRPTVPNAPGKTKPNQGPHD